MYDQKGAVGMNSQTHLQHSGTHNGSSSKILAQSFHGQHAAAGNHPHQPAQYSSHSPQKVINNSRPGGENVQGYYNQHSKPTAAGPQQSSSSQNQMAIQKQIQQLQKQQQMAAMSAAMQQQSSSNLQMKNQLQGAASNIIANNASSTHNISQQENQAQYDDLKKKLLTEYKKIQKKSGAIVYQGNQVPPAQESDGSIQQQIEQTLQNSANALSQSQQQQINEQTQGGNSQNSQGNGNNLNNSTTSAHLNVYKPTFIINNSFQPGGAGDVQSQQNQQQNQRDPSTTQSDRRETKISDSSMPEGQQNKSSNVINNPQNIPINQAGLGQHSMPGARGNSAHRDKNAPADGGSKSSAPAQGAVQPKPNQNLLKRSANQQPKAGQSGQISGVGAPHGHSSGKNSKNTMLNSNQQQMLLMNVLMNQGMSKAQAEAQVQAQMQQMHNVGTKTFKEGRANPIDAMQIHTSSAAAMIKKPQSSGGRHHGSQRGVTPTQEKSSQQNVQYMKQFQNQLMVAPSSDGRGPTSSGHNKSRDHQMREQNAQFASSNAQFSNAQFNQGSSHQAPQSHQMHQALKREAVGTLSAANLPHSSNVVTGGKMINTAGMRGNSQTLSRQEISTTGGHGGASGYQNVQMQQHRRK